MVPRRSLILLCLLAPLLAAHALLAQPATPSAANPSAMRAAGDSTQSFIVVSKRITPTGSLGFSAPPTPIDITDVLRRGSSDKEWKAFSGAAGFVSDLTLHRGQLMLLMVDGSWRAMYDGGSASGEPLPPQTSAKLILLAGEGPDLLGYAQDNSGGTGRLVRREAGNWVELGSAPKVPDVVKADMAVFGDRVFLATGLQDGTVQLWRSAQLTRAATRPATRAASRPLALIAATQAVEWESLGTIAAGTPLAGTRLLPLGNDPAKDIGVWADPGLTNGGVVYRWRGGENWERAFSLGPVNGELAASLGQLRFYADAGASNEPGTTRPISDPKTGSQGGDTFEYAVSYDGKYLGKPLSIDRAQEGRRVREMGELIVGMATAGLMLSIIVWWRKREHWTVEVVTAAQGLPLAPVGRRLLAGIIDVLPWLGTLAFLFYRNAIVVEIPPFRTMESVLFLLYAYATVLTHTTICELIFGRTIGMAAAGLRVTNMAGNRATPGQILTRNLCRAIDMVLVAPYLAVFTSPLNQSLGDAAGGTLVLTRDSANIPPAPPKEPTP